MSLYHSEKDEKVLLDELPRICKEHRKRELEEEPTAAERTLVMDTITKFIRSKDRIVYGGYALHLLITSKSDTDAIYDSMSFPDVEFYTPHLKEDVRDLAEMFMKKGFKHTSAEENVHPTTFIIRVNFEGVCDITFYPTRFYDSIPTVRLDGMRVVTPEFAMIDIFKIYSFPLNNYFRLIKTYRRANLLLKHFPLSFASHSLRKVSLPMENVLVRSIKDMKETVIITGSYAHNVYVSQAGLESSHKIPVPFLTVVSTNFGKDITVLKEKLKKNNWKVTTKHYLPFLELLGQRIDFLVGGSVVLRVFEETGTCVPYRLVNGLYVTTIQGTAYYSLVQWSQARMEKWDEARKHHETIIHNLEEAKRSFFSSSKHTITDATLFQEFVIDCLGNRVSALKNAALLRLERKKLKQCLKYRYDPGEKNSTFMATHFFLPLAQLVSAVKSRIGH